MTTNNPYSAFLFSIWNGQTYFVANCYFNNLYVYGNLIDNNGDLLMVNSELRGLVLQSNKCVFNNSKKMWVYNTNIEATFNKIFLNDTSYYGKSTSIDFRLVNSIAYTFYDTVIHNKVYNPMYTEYVTNNISNKSISGPNSVSNCSVLYNSLYNPTNAVLIDKGVTPMGVTQFPIKDYFGYPRVAGSSIDIGYSEYQVTTDVQVSNISNSVEAVKMYPNPSAGSIHIQSNDDVEIQIMDQTGQVYIETQLDKGDNNIDVNQLTNGIYFIHFKNKNDLKVQKLIIQK
jgi:hypothetical protein